MGADLYIRSINDRAKAKWDPFFNDAVNLRDAVRGGRNPRRGPGPDLGGVNVVSLFTKVNDAFLKAFPKDEKLKAALAALGEHVAFGHGTAGEANDHAQVAVNLAYARLYNHPGYYRDSYNATNCLSRVGLSWWNDVVPMLSAKRELTPAKAKRLSARITKALPKIKLPSKGDLLKDCCTVTDSGENSLASWHKYYKDGIRELIRFLDRAVRLGEPIDCSL